MSKCSASFQLRRSNDKVTGRRKRQEIAEIAAY